MKTQTNFKFYLTKLRGLTLTLVILCSIGVGNVWGAAEIVYTLDGTTTGGSAGYDVASDIEQDEISWKVTGNTTMNPWRLGGKGGSKSSSTSNLTRTIYNTDPIADDITSIVIKTGTKTLNALTNINVKVTTGSNGSGTVKQTFTETLQASHTYTFDKPAGQDWSGCYYLITFTFQAKGTSNQYIQFLSAEFYSEASSCEKITTAPSVTATPGDRQISLSWPNQAEASSYTVTCAGGTPGAVTGTTTKSCTITGLTNGTSYTWTVTPVGDGSTYCAEGNTAASASATPNVSRTITYYDKDGQHTTSMTDGTNIADALNALYGVGGPTSCDATNYEYFVGWKDGSISGTASSVTLLDDEVVNSTNAAKTFYAVWSDTDPSAGGSELFSWEGSSDNGSTSLTNMSGVTANGLGSDYAASNAPYRVKLDNTGDYIIITVASPPTSVALNIKMLGGGSTSSITVQESTATNGTFTDVETLSIEGSQNDVLELETSNSFAATTRAIKLYFTKGSNVGLGGITVNGLSGTANYITTCCTALGTINGSVSLTQLATPDPTKLKATWSMTSTTGISSYTLEVYNSSNTLVKTINNYTSGAEITGLTPCTEYYVKLYTVSSGGSFCEGGLIGTSTSCTTNGYTLTVNKSNVTLSSGSEPTNICANVSATYSAAGGYSLPTSITVTNAGAQNTGWTWNSSTGVLTINKANVTGNVVVTITATANACSSYSFHYGTDGSSDWLINCFEYSGNSDRQWIQNATIANKSHYYVGKQGNFYNNALGNSNAKSYTNQMQYMQLALDRSHGSNNQLGSNYAGVQGTLLCYDNSPSDNLYVDFLPAGYYFILDAAGTKTALPMTCTNADMSAANILSSNSVWETEIQTVTSVSYKYTVGIKADAAIAGNAWQTTRYNTNENMTTLKKRNSSNGFTGTLAAADVTAGTRGKYRIWADNFSTTAGEKNWYAHFVPYYQLTYDANGGTGSMSALPATPVSCEESAANRTVTVGACSFTAPVGKEFKEWNTQADGNGTTIATGNRVLTGDLKLYAIWKNTTYTISSTLTNVNSTPAIPSSYTYTGSAANLSYTISANSGYVLPSSVTVSGTTYTWNQATGVLTLTGVISSNVSISISGTAIDQFVDLVHGTVVANKTTTYDISTVTIPDKPAATTGTCNQLHYHFVGWITKAKHDAGTAIAAGDIQSGSKTPNGTTYYAVWAKEVAGGGAATYQKVTSTAGITNDGRYLIVYETDGAAFDGSLDALDVESNVVSTGTITSNTISITDANKTTLANAEFTIDMTNKYVISHSGKYIDKNSYANGLTGISTPTAVHSISINGSGNLVIEGTGSSGSTYVQLKFNDASNQLRFRFYKTGQQAIQLYKYTSSVSWGDYVSSCGETYNITLKKNGGTTDGSATVTENAAQLNSGFTPPVRAGYQVEGYYTTSACATKIATAEGVFQKSITVSSTPWTDANGKWVKGGDATFYAKWEAKQCVITLNNVGADIEPGTPSVTATYGANTNLTTSITKPKKTGYVFGGYYTEPSGEGTQLINANGEWLASKTGYTNASMQWQLDQAALTLYAKWTIETYTVNWYVNGVSVAHEDNVPYGRSYSNLTNEPTVANNALASCNSNKFIGWVTADGQYTADGGTKALQYDPYTVTGSTTITADRKDFYAMFATETGSSFDLSVTSGDFKIFGLVSDVRYYVSGALSNGAYGITTDADAADEFTFTKVSDGVYTIKHKRSNKFVTWSSSTNFGEATTAINWTITAASHGSWCVEPATATTRAFVMYYSSSNPENNNVFKPYAKSNVTNTPAQYYYVEIGGGTLTDYRTGCCSEKITITVTGATNGTYTLKFNNAAQTSGAMVSTCSASTVEFKVTANAGYTLTNMSISGTNKTLTITPSPITTGLPSTNEMTYTVSVPALATGTLTITPTFTQTYSATYNLDGGETTGSTATVRYRSGESVTLVTPAPTKTGYDFTGWTVTKAGGGTVAVSAGAFTMPSDNVTITAGWSAKALTSISVTPTTAEVYVGQYVELPVTYDPADVLTKGYTLVAPPAYCVTTGSTNTTFKITGGRAGVTITENVSETVSIKATADNTKTASVTVTVKPLPVDHFLDLVHGETFADQSASIVDNALSAAYTAPSHADVPVPGEGNACEKGHLHLVGWIESEWADAHLTATMTEMMAAEDGSGNALFHAAYDPMTASGKTYYAVWGHEVE